MSENAIACSPLFCYTGLCCCLLFAFRFDPAFEDALTAAENDPNNAKCNGDLGCILDTVALGDEAGDAYLNEPAILETIVAEIIESPPAPTPAPVPPPTPYPTSGPTSAPTSGPTKAPTPSGGDDSGSGGDGSRNENYQSGSNGDPHCEFPLCSILSRFNGMPFLHLSLLSHELISPHMDR